MHTIVDMGDAQGWAVVARRINGADHIVFTTPKRAVAWGVCMALNGAAGSLDDRIFQADEFLKLHEAGAYSNFKNDYQ